MDLKTCIFVDLGSGKGKSLILAADYPFKKIIGVEFPPELHQTAVRNIALFSREKCIQEQIQLLCMDAEQYELPTENIVLFLYNPFLCIETRNVLNCSRTVSFCAPRKNKRLQSFIRALADECNDSHHLLLKSQLVVYP